jgi:hypothetical protein
MKKFCSSPATKHTAITKLVLFNGGVKKKYALLVEANTNILAMKKTLFRAKISIAVEAMPI